MNYVGGVFLVFSGCVMLFKPKTMWKISDSWKTKNNSEPTSFYLKFIQAGGLVLTVGGILALFDM